MKVYQKYECEDGSTLELLSYFWPDEEWYVGWKGNVFTRTRKHLKKLIEDGKLKIITSECNKQGKL